MSFKLKQTAGLLAAVLILSLSGCGGPGYDIAPVEGRITCEGEPVAGGSITFRPIAVEGAKDGGLSKPASGEVGEDGAFTMTTIDDGDGAAVGRHEVRFTPHMVGATSYEDKPEPSPYLGMVPEPNEIEIKPGKNELEFKLVPRPKRR